jgi:hypothetical protein
VHQGYRKISRINVVICPSVCEASGFSTVNEWLDILFQFFFSHLASVYNGMQLWKKEHFHEGRTQRKHNPSQFSLMPSIMLRFTKRETRHAHALCRRITYFPEW